MRPPPAPRLPAQPNPAWERREGGAAHGGEPGGEGGEQARREGWGSLSTVKPQQPPGPATPTPPLSAQLRTESRRRPPRPRCPSGRTHLRRRRRGKARRAAAAAAARGKAGGRGRRSWCSARAAAHGPAPAAPGKFAVRFRRLPPRSRAPPRGDAQRSWERGRGRAARSRPPRALPSTGGTGRRRVTVRPAVPGSAAELPAARGRPAAPRPDITGPESPGQHRNHGNHRAALGASSREQRGPSDTGSTEPDVPGTGIPPYRDSRLLSVTPSRQHRVFLSRSPGVLTGGVQWSHPRALHLGVPPTWELHNGHCEAPGTAPLLARLHRSTAALGLPRCTARPPAPRAVRRYRPRPRGRAGLAAAPISQPGPLF